MPSGIKKQKNQSMFGRAELGMRLDPAMGGEVHGDAGGEETDADGQGGDDPVKLDMAFEETEIEDAEDQDEDSSFREEC